jgi:O-antigen/teichoic acid export membrane protein
MFSKILKSEFVRNILTLMTGTAIAQAIPVLISPILSRLYTPEDFGVLGLFMSIAAVLGVIATGRYELAIMLPEKKRDAYNLLALSLFLTLVVSVFTLILVLIFKNPVTLFFDEPGIEPWLYLLPVVVLFVGIFQAFNYWSTRQKTFKRNAVGRVSQSTIMSATNVGMGIAKAGSSGMILGYILGQFVGALVLAWQTLTHLKEFRKEITRKEIIENAKKYKSFIRINTPHAFIDSLQNNGIIYLIMYFFSKMILGSYFFAFRVLKAPVGLIGNAIYQVFYQKATEALKERREIQTLVKRIYRNLFLIGFPVFLLLFIFAQPVFTFVFGEKWEISGEIAQILMPWLFLNFMVSPVSCIAIIMNKQREAMFITFVDIFLKVIAIVIGGISNDFKLGFIIMSTLCSLLMIFALFWYYKIAKTEFAKTY